MYEKAKILMLDLDGTVYRGNVALENIDILNGILNDKTVVFLTNSGTKTPDDVETKLRRLGFCIDRSVFNCYTALQHLNRILQDEYANHNVFYVTNKELQNSLGCNDSVFNTLTIQKAFEIVESNTISNTIVAFFIDTIELFDVDEYVTATSIILSNGGKVFFSAGDMVVPTCTNGLYVNHPGPGSIISILKGMTSKNVHRNIHIMGKGYDKNFMKNAFAISQNAYFSKHADSTTCSWEDVIVVGDNPLTDIAAGLQMGALTVLVNTGMKNDHDKLFYNRPHLLTESLGNLVSSDRDKPSKIGLHYLIDVIARRALNVHKFINEVTNSSLSYCLEGISSAPIKKTQSSPCRLYSLQ